MFPALGGRDQCCWHLAFGPDWPPGALLHFVDQPARECGIEDQIDRLFDLHVCFPLRLVDDVEAYEELDARFVISARKTSRLIEEQLFDR